MLAYIVLSGRTILTLQLWATRIDRQPLCSACCVLIHTTLGRLFESYHARPTLAATAARSTCFAEHCASKPLQHRSSVLVQGPKPRVAHHQHGSPQGDLCGGRLQRHRHKHVALLQMREMREVDVYGAQQAVLQGSRRLTVALSVSQLVNSTPPPLWRKLNGSW
jgi:hypothetical protein